MKQAILKRDVKGKNFNLKKGTKVFIAQSNIQGTLVRLKENDTIEYPVATEALKIIVPEKIKLKIHVKRLPRRNDSMFYYGQHIATLKKGKRTVIVESAGEIAASFTEEGDCYANDMLAKELKVRKVTDRGLGTLGVNDFIRMNNWFRIIELATNGKDIIANNYDDAIETAKSLLK